MDWVKLTDEFNSVIYNINHTENNYSINIQGNHGGNGGSGGGNGNNQSPKSNPKPKTKNYLKAIANKTVPMNHISDSNLERGK